MRSLSFSGKYEVQRTDTSNQNDIQVTGHLLLRVRHGNSNAFKETVKMSNTITKVEQLKLVVS
jgi:hypothetical protein